MTQFADYEINITLNIRRRKDTYSGENLASVESKELLTLSETDLLTTFSLLVDQAASKAIKQTGIKRDAERKMLALEAGDTIDAS